MLQTKFSGHHVKLEICLHIEVSSLKESTMAASHDKCLANNSLFKPVTGLFEQKFVSGGIKQQGL